MLLVTILAVEENAVNATWLQSRLEFPHEDEITLNLDTFFLSKRRHRVVIVEKRGRIVRVISERVTGHLPIKSHALNPKALIKKYQASLFMLQEYFVTMGRYN